MRIIETLPSLSQGEGSLWTHNTGGEHATKFFGMESAVNALVEETLSVKNGSAVGSYSEEDFHALLFNSQSDVVLVEHIPEGEDTPGRNLAGLLVARRTNLGNFSARTVIEAVAVNPPLQRNGIAGFMIGKAIDHLAATELVLDTSRLEIPEWLPESLRGVGFTHKLDNGLPAMWTHNYFARVYVEETFYSTKLSEMPEHWNGELDIYRADESDGRKEIFRDGKLVGSLRHVPDSIDFDDEIDSTVSSYDIFDPSGEPVARIERQTQLEAIHNLLNQHGLAAT